MAAPLEAWTRRRGRERAAARSASDEDTSRHDESERAAATKAERKEVVGVAELLAEVRELRGAGEPVRPPQRHRGTSRGRPAPSIPGSPRS